VPCSVCIAATWRAGHAETATAASAAMDAAMAALQSAVERVDGCEELLMRTAQRRPCIDAYADPKRHTMPAIRGVDDITIAPFHFLAAENRVYTYETHPWHVTTLADVCAADPRLLRNTRFRVADLTDPSSDREIAEWWEELTDEGGDGIVVKPLEWLARGRRNLVQPALKCRGREALRAFYGPEYTLTENLERLRERPVSVKRSLALREYALGIESLQRFIVEEPLHRVHECVLGVLALESEAVDPRL
jgi:protein phosphatase